MYVSIYAGHVYRCCVIYIDTVDAETLKSRRLSSPRIMSNPVEVGSGFGHFWVTHTCGFGRIFYVVSFWFNFPSANVQFNVIRGNSNWLWGLGCWEVDPRKMLLQHRSIRKWTHKNSIQPPTRKRTSLNPELYMSRTQGETV